MRLISCHIENFGTLSKRDFTFSDGLTVIKEENGFGKTTLADFIKAMFYGLPKSGPRDLRQNDRKRYIPWNGGSFGGNLVFETEGKKYRIERIFGKRSSSDEYKLFDSNTNRISGDYSKNIGEELFGLDCDSFMRSAYIPQLFRDSSFGTDKIKEKLIGSVRDEDPSVGLEAAVDAIKKKRTSLKLYKGRGGSIDNTEDRLSRVRISINGAKEAQKRLEEKLAEHSEIQEKIKEKKAGIDNIRRQIAESMEYGKNELLLRENVRLQNEKKYIETEISKLNEKYSGGLPDESEISELRNIAGELDMIETRSPQKSVSMPAELASKFRNGLPSEEDINKYRKKYDEFISADTELSGIGLSAPDENELSELESFFSVGLPDDKELERLDGDEAALSEMKIKLDSYGLSPDERKEFSELEEFFKGKVPEKNDIEESRKKLESIERLKQKEKGDFISADKDLVGTERPLALRGAVFMVLGVGLAAAGIFMLLMSAHVFAAVLPIGGVVVFLWGLRLMLLSSYKSKAPDSFSDRNNGADQNEREAAKLEKELDDFLLTYFSDVSSPIYDLTLLDTKLERFLNLSRRKNELEKIFSEEQKKYIDAQNKLGDFLFRYYGDDFDIKNARSFISDLRQKRRDCLRLEEKRRISLEKKTDCEDRKARLGSDIETFLKSYYSDGIESGHYSKLLSDLQRDSQEYRSISEKIEEQKAFEHDEKNKADSLKAELDGILKKYGISPQRPYKDFINVVYADRTRLTGLRNNKNKNSISIEKFEKENGDVSGIILPTDYVDANMLKQRETSVQKELDFLLDRNSKCLRNIEALREEAESLPVYEDELERLEQRLGEDKNKQYLLDETIKMLQKANDNLSLSYTAAVHEGFRTYETLLSAESEGEVFISPDLKVELERAGASRDLGYFSAGSADIVMLCIRLSLVDAMFENEKPFIILDDPFVNLDDRHTERALETLSKLSEDRQIIYLVCNSSRVPTKTNK